MAYYNVYRYVLFSASVQRWDILKRHITSLTLKSLSITRWESRVESLKPIRFQINEINDALIEISECPHADIGTRHEANCLANKLTDFKFLVSIVVWYDLLFRINIVSKSMQNVTIDKLLLLHLLNQV